MSIINITYVMASFTAPIEIGATPLAMLWLLPLAAAIATIYKVTKLEIITTGVLLKEIVALFGSIILFIITAALVLYALAWLITE